MLKSFKNVEIWSYETTSQFKDKCLGWLQIAPTSFISPKDLFRWVNEAPVSSNKKLVLEAVVCATLWLVWRYRNDVVHEARVMRKNMLFDSIREFSFLWCNRAERMQSISFTIFNHIEILQMQSISNKFVHIDS
ncbi:hypothetical protein LXL04_006723 [Taraxacum kok-saghyz]